MNRKFYSIMTVSSRYVSSFLVVFMTIPRIMTVDSTGSIARIVRSAIELLDLSVSQIDVPNSEEALDSLHKVSLVITAFVIDADMKGFELAMRIKQSSPETSTIILGDVDDPSEFDEEDSPFVYLGRPIDVHQFLRVMVGGLENHEAMMTAIAAPATEHGDGTIGEELGPVPLVDVNNAQAIIDSLLTDLGAMAIILASREGETLLERGAVGYIDRDELASALAPVMIPNINLTDMLGGRVSTVQFYDGDDIDVYLLSIGLHYFMCVMFDGQQGARHLGPVNRYGRQAAEDLIALLGPDAFHIRIPEKTSAITHRSDKKKTGTMPIVEEEPVQLAKSDFGASEEMAEPEPVIEQLDAIPDDLFDEDLLFGSDVSVDEDLFSLDNMEKVAKEGGKKGKMLDWDDADKIGLLDS